MILCSICGNKRCPHATDHNLPCTNSNDVGQKGSIFGEIDSNFPKQAFISRSEAKRYAIQHGETTLPKEANILFRAKDVNGNGMFEGWYVSYYLDNVIKHFIIRRDDINNQVEIKVNTLEIGFWNSELL